MNRLDTYVNDDVGYLNDHLAGAAAAIQHVDRMRAREPDTELGHVMQAMRLEIAQDRAVLERVIAALGGSPNPVKRAGALGAEMLASLRMQMPFLGAGSTEATRLEELEMLSLGVEGKRLLWKTLEELKTTDMRLEGFDFRELEQRANGQRERLERFRLRYAAEALRVRAS